MMPLWGNWSLRTAPMPRALPWHGFRLLRLSLPLVAVGMEFCWVYPWVLFFTGLSYGRSPVPFLSAWSVCGLLVLGHLTVRVALALPWPLRLTRVGVVAMGVVAGLSTVKITYYPEFVAWDLGWVWVLVRAAHDALPVVVPPVTGALAVTALWGRGVVLGEREFTHFEIERAFRRGVGWSVLFVLLFALYGDTAGFSLAGPAAGYLLAFLSLSLVALAVARLVGIWEESQADEDQALAINRHWLLLLVGVVGLIFVVATSVSGLLGMNLWAVLLAIVRPLAPILEVLFFIIFAVAMIIARGILFVISRLRFGRTAVPPAAPSDPFAEFLRRIQSIGFSPDVVSGARWGMVLVVVGVLSVLVAISVVRARRRKRQGDGDERESVWSADAALAGVGAAWRSLWARRRQVEASAGPEVNAIRALYRDLLRLGARLGVPRQRYQTPYEYLPRLHERLPNSGSDLVAMTDAYVRVRYTPHAPRAEEIAEAQLTLERIVSRTERVEP